MATDDVLVFEDRHIFVTKTADVEANPVLHLRRVMPVANANVLKHLGEARVAVADRKAKAVSIIHVGGFEQRADHSAVGAELIPCNSHFDLKCLEACKPGLKRACHETPKQREACMVHFQADACQTHNATMTSRHAVTSAWNAYGERGCVVLQQHL
jgi:hypothetical protein